MSDQLLFSLGAFLVFAGFLLTFVAVILMFFTSARGKWKVKGGGAIIIGPFPIVFGTDKKTLKILIILSISLIVITLIITVASLYIIR